MDLGSLLVQSEASVYGGCVGEWSFLTHLSSSEILMSGITGTRNRDYTLRGNNCVSILRELVCFWCHTEPMV